MIPSSSSGSNNPSGQAGTIAGQSGPGPHRSLSDDVFPSAKDELRAGGADDYAGLSRGDSMARSGGVSGGVESPYTGTVSSESTSGASRLGMGTSEGSQSGQGYFSRMESQLTDYVKEKPGTAAMMAAGAGALLALLLGKRGKNRR